VTIFCLETAAKQIKISLRSNGRVAINQIAAGYNGGGHPSAAGATVSGPLEEVLADVTAKVRQLLETHP
jgi:phosphoesterase RecJ-like protein